MGFVGLGRIGTATALRAKVFGMMVIYYDPFKPDGYDKSLGIRCARSVRELFQSSHVFSLHCPLTADFRHLVNHETIRWLPQGAFLINTARGAVVDASVVPAAIECGHLAGAAIDVLAEEPPKSTDPLLAAWRNPLHPAHHRLVVNLHSAFLL